MKRTLISLAAAGLVATSAAAFAADAPAAAGPHPTATSAMHGHGKHHDTRHLSRRTVEEMQVALKAGGADITVDGVWGPKTSSALRDFQSAHDLKPTGQLDRATAAKLNLPHWG